MGVNSPLLGYLELLIVCANSCALGVLFLLLSHDSARLFALEMRDLSG
jgi:hypothetical protein